MAELEQELERALQFGDEGDWDAMAAYLRDLLEDAPGDPAVLCWLGVAERELGMEGVAYERFKACLAADPTDAHILAAAGSGLARFDDPTAEPALRTAALTAPDLAYARIMYGAYLSREGMFEDARRELAAALTLEPDDPETLTELGVLLALSGSLEEAVEAFYRPCEVDPEDGWARALAGLALVSLGRTEEAVGDLLSAADLRPDDVELALLAALAAAVSEDVGRAYELVERARLRAIPGDREIVEAVSDRVEEGSASSQAFLTEEFAAGAFRERLMTRP